MKSNPNLVDTQGLIQINPRVIIADLDENKIFGPHRPQRLPAAIRTDLADRLQRLLHPELSTCDFAEADLPNLDPQAVAAYVFCVCLLNVRQSTNPANFAPLSGIREAFFRVFVDLFEGLELKKSSSLLEEQSDSQQVKDRKAYVSSLQSQSPTYQYFVDYLQNDNLLLSIFRLPREAVDATITAALKGPSNFLTFSEPETHKLETKTRPDVTPWDTRLYYQPRFEFLSSHVEKIISSQPELTDLYVLRVHYLLADKRSTQLVANLKELSRVDPHNPLLECRDLFNTLFSQLPGDKVEALSREQDRVGDWARFFYLHEKRRSSEELSPESLAVFKYVADNSDTSSQVFADMIKKNLPALGCHKDNMSLLMLAAAELKPKMSYILLKFNAASDFEGSNGSAIHFFLTPRYKARTEVQYLLLVRVIGMLLARGEEVDKRDIYMCSALIKLCQRSTPSVTMMRFLLANSADPNVSDVDGLSPLSSLLKSKQNPLPLGDAEAYATLLEYGTNILALHRPYQELEEVVQALGSAILRDTSLTRLHTLHGMVTSKRDAFARIAKAQMEAQPQSPTPATKMPHAPANASKILITNPSGAQVVPLSPTSSSSASAPSETNISIKMKRLHSDAFATATFEICEAQFQHLIRLHIMCHKYLEPLQRPDSKHIGRKEKVAAEHILSFAKPLRELLMTHNTLFSEIRKENAVRVLS